MALFEARDISASFGRDAARVPVFSQLDFKLEASYIYDLVGQSGTGKSTLLRVCAQMLDRDSGSLFLDGSSSEEIPFTTWRRKVCLVPQKTALTSGTVKENLLSPWSLKIHAGEEKPTDKELTYLLQAADLSDITLDRDVSQLSGGQAARISLLRVFATKPHVLLLDEVDAALDDETSRAVSKLTASLVDESMTCLRIRHRASDGFAKGTYTLSQGSINYENNATPESNMAHRSQKQVSGFESERVTS